MLNRAIFIGRMARDPELRYTQSGKPVCNFTIATARKFNKEETDFIDITVWGKMAEVCGEHLSKGRLISVEGSIRVDTYTDREGNKRKKFGVQADEVKFLDKKKGTNVSDSAVNKDDWGDIAKEVKLEEDDDDIPF